MAVTAICYEITCQPVTLANTGQVAVNAQLVAAATNLDKVVITGLTLQKESWVKDGYNLVLVGRNLFLTPKQAVGHNERPTACCLGKLLPKFQRCQSQHGQNDTHNPHPGNDFGFVIA